MRALLAVGGEAPPRHRVLSLLDGIGLICAADSGFDHVLAWGLEPDLVVGDMDSVADPLLLASHPRAEVHRLEVAKDESDTEAALALCRARGASEVVIVGGGGGRLDHLLAIRALFERPQRPNAWYLASDSLHLVPSGSVLAFEAARGETVSVFPLAGGAGEMGSRGLRWPLAGLAWKAGDYGLSNEALGGEVEVSAGRGDLLVVRDWRGRRGEAEPALSYG